MSHTGEDRAGVRVALPDGWIQLQPASAAGHVGGRVVQLLTVAHWAGQVVRPTLSVTLAPATGPLVARVLADAQARVPGVHVLAIDPWRVPGVETVGRRLVFTHLVGDVTVTTLVWAMTTTAGDVMVTARSEGTELHVHDRAFVEAVSRIRLPADAPATDPSAGEAEGGLAGTPTPAWTPGDGSGTAIVRDPHARILVEASVGRTTLRLDATLARDLATVRATSSPRAVIETGDRSGVSGHGTTALQVPPTRLALTIAQWLGLGPARTTMQPVTLPLSLMMSRLLDPHLPVPDEMDVATWAQPWFLWTLRSSATDSGLVMVDTGRCGQVAVMEGDDERATRFSPLSSYNVWLTLNWLVNESLVRR